MRCRGDEVFGFPRSGCFISSLSRIFERIVDARHARLPRRIFFELSILSAVFLSFV